MRCSWRSAVEFLMFLLAMKYGKRFSCDLFCSNQTEAATRWWTMRAKNGEITNRSTNQFIRKYFTHWNTDFLLHLYPLLLLLLLPSKCNRWMLSLTFVLLEFSQWRRYSWSLLVMMIYSITGILYLFKIWHQLSKVGVLSVRQILFTDRTSHRERMLERSSLLEQSAVDSKSPSPSELTVICCPHFKLFDFNSQQSEKLDSKTIKLFEKVDGILVTLYFYDGNWRIASRDSLDSSENVYQPFFAKRTYRHYATDPLGLQREPLTLRDLFWSIWNKRNYKLPTSPHFCYMFELISPSTPLIVQYEEDLLLHGVRDLFSLAGSWFSTRSKATQLESCSTKGIS